MKIENICVWLACAAVIATGQTAPSQTATLENQKKVSVTVYNGGFGVVRDERSVKLPLGMVELKFMEIASQIQPETVQIDPLTAGEQLTVLEQNYEYDLMSPENLLEKYVGKEVTLIERNDYKGWRNEKKALLLSYNNRQPIYKIDDKIVIYRPEQEIEFSTIPENLVSKPTLVWLLNNTLETEQTIVANYMTQGMRWNADYVVVLATNEANCNVNGWVTLNNNSGATFKDAQLKLVAGDVQRVQPPAPRMERRMVMDMAMAAPGKGFEEESMFEYHLYTLDRPTTLKQNQQKQISLLEAQKVPITKKYRCIGEQNLFRNQRGDLIKNIKIGVFVEFKNSAEQNLGMPLPKGVVRVYKADSSGNNQFVGEDSIDHTPKDEKIELKLGDAFDIVSERRQTGYSVLGDRRFEMSWEIKIRNHKPEDISVEVVEPIGGEWQVLESSFPYVKKDQGTIVFTVPVKKDSEAVLTYKVKVEY